MANISCLARFPKQRSNCKSPNLSEKLPCYKYYEKTELNTILYIVLFLTDLVERMTVLNRLTRVNWWTSVCQSLSRPLSWWWDRPCQRSPSRERPSIRSCFTSLPIPLPPRPTLPPPSAGVLLLLQCRFPQYDQLLHCHLWIVTRENNAFYCFG